MALSHGVSSTPLLVAALLLAVTGCGGEGGDGEASPTTTSAGATTGVTETAEQRVDLAQSCRNEEGAFTVRYPAGWHTNEGGGVPACTFFHPEPFELPEATEVLDVAVRIDREPVPIERVAGDNPGRRDVSRRELTVAGRPAERLEYESTGEALLPEGIPVTEYLVDLNGETLVAATAGVGSLDYEANVEVLDAMVGSLSIGTG